MESGRGLLLLFEQGHLKVYIMKGIKRTNLIMICRSLSRKGPFASCEEFSTKKKGLMTSSMHPESQLKSTTQMVHLSDKYISPTVFKFLLFTFTTLYIQDIGRQRVKDLIMKRLRGAQQKIGENKMNKMKKLRYERIRKLTVKSKLYKKMNQF